MGNIVGSESMRARMKKMGKDWNYGKRSSTESLLSFYNYKMD